ncbi:uncharacterized protein LOC129584702 [Paramacrobiotus metropolitanus]|uniref:uncharacterized protein LOC129584702 n=1 Tax=Paramacrobiotus metropolitanus TaxID=2943436 RepID=UPI0024462441|nr:uncharacterized protein LOC129584702 [Paramacrobiotus metropolitanus]
MHPEGTGVTIPEGAEPPVVRKIAVIGAGMAGMCVLKHFSVDPQYEVVAFERSNVIGGIWNYPAECETKTDSTGLEPHYCRMYREVRLNSPRCLTGYPDFPFPKGGDTYCPREVALQYFQNYARTFELHKFIKFRHNVLNVTPATRNPDESVSKWSVQVENLQTGETTVEEFHNVIICNGHFHKPYIPPISGLQDFKGPIVHSGEYRSAEAFRNKTVLVIGGRSSANDVTFELIPFAKRVFICRRIKSSVFKGIPNIEEVTDIGKIGANYITFSEGYTHPIHAIILCTGFLFDFPFLSKECEVTVTRGRVFPMYKHMMHCFHPSLAFMGLANRNLHSFVCNYQVRYYKAYLDGKFELPPASERLAEINQEHRERLAKGLPEHYAHVMTVTQWDYIDQLCRTAGMQSYDPVVKMICESSIEEIRKSPHNFRNFRLEKLDSKSFLHIPNTFLTERQRMQCLSEEELRSLARRYPHFVVHASTYRNNFRLPAELRG